MTSQITSVCRKCYASIRNIGKIRDVISTDICKLLVNTLVTSRIDFGNSLYCNLPISQMCRLQRVQNTSARIITRMKKYTSITPVMYGLHWLPVVSRVHYKVAWLTYHSLHSGPTYLSDLVTQYVPRRRLRSEGSHLLTVPSTKRQLKCADRAFSKCAPSLWNDFPANLRDPSMSKAKFRTSLKTHLFQTHYAEFQN